MATESILNNTKKVLGVAEDYDAFDTDIMMHINTAISALTQLGVGPVDGYMIEGADEKWSDFLGDDHKKFLSAKSYIYLRVRMMFDPPATSFVLDSMQRQIDELGWRLNVSAEPGAPIPATTVCFDGGSPWR